MEINLDKQLSKIKEKFSQYITDPKYIFKSVNDKIVIMSLCDDSVTNESRLSVANNEFAKHRTNKVKVELIFDKLTLEICEETVGIFTMSIGHCKITNYVTNKITIPDSFDYDLDNVCSNGIHYYKNIECAFYYKIKYIKNVLYNGLIKIWKDHGNLTQITEFQKSKPCGLMEFFNVCNEMCVIPKIKISNFNSKLQCCGLDYSYSCVLQTFDEQNKITSEGILTETKYVGTSNKSIRSITKVLIMHQLISNK